MSKTVEEILHNLNDDAKKERASCTERGNWEGYNFKYDKLESEAIEAINKLIIEARIDEVRRRYVHLILHNTDEFKWKEYADNRIVELQQSLKGKE